MPKYLLLLVFLSLVGAFPALGQGLPLRALPQKGERGQVGEQQPLPHVKIGGKTLRMAPGGVIYDQNNRSILHGHLPANAHVYFTRDMNGDVQRIYLLTDDERARLDRAATR